MKIESKCDKINEYLSSFVVESDQFRSESGNSFHHENLKPKAKPTKVPSEDQVLSLSSSPGSSVRRLSLGKKKTLPNSEDNFKGRLSTFEYGLWTCIDISPLLCSSYGWYLKEKDVLQCITCKAFLCSTLPPPNQHEAYMKFSNILKERLITAHENWCGWPHNPCSAEFLHPPFYLTAHYAMKLREEALKLYSLDTKLPYFDHQEVLNEMNMELRHVSIFYGSRITCKNQLSAALLVLCGWLFGSSDKLRCNLCLRSIGLWSFLSQDKEKEFLRLKQRDYEKQERNRQREVKRKEKEQKQKVKEEKKIAKLEAKKRAEETEFTRQLEAQKVQEAMEKISQMENDTYEQPESSEEEEMEEDEENSLLSAEDECENDAGLNEDSIENQEEENVCEQENSGEDSSSSSSSKDSVSNRGDELDSEEEKKIKLSGTEESDSNSSSRSSLKHEDSDADEEQPEEEEGEKTCSPEAAEESEVGDSCLFDQSKDDDCQEEEEEEDDDLWLEAVGGVNSMVPESPSEGSSPKLSRRSSESSLISNSSFSDKSFDHTRKRPRSSGDSQDTFDGDSDENENPSKILKLKETDEEEQRETPSCSSGSHLESPNEESNESLYRHLTPEANHEKESESSDSKEESEIEESEPEDEDDSMYQKMKNSLFKPLEQHRHWCGWIIDASSLHLNAEEGGNVKPLMGFKILPPQLKDVLPDMCTDNLASSEKYVRNIEGLRAVRHILESWEVIENVDDDEEEMVLE